VTEGICTERQNVDLVVTSNATDGAWGLRFPQVVGADQVMVAAPHWPCVGLSVHYDVNDDQPVDSEWDERGMRVPLQAGGYLKISWPAEVDLTLRSTPAPECLIQPHMSTAAAALAMRHGRQPFHAGAFIVNGEAWGVLGAANAGKSTTLALAQARGLPVLTDDLLVVDNGAAYAGPRCIDLRPEAAEVLGMGTDLGIVGLRERWRVYLDECAPQAPVRGWIVPKWGNTELTPVRPGDRLPTLLAHSALQGITMNNPDQYLALASLPTIVWARPQDWSAVGPSLDRLLDEIASIPKRKH
jgi:hypothetical protein